MGALWDVVRGPAGFGPSLEAVSSFLWAWEERREQLRQSLQNTLMLLCPRLLVSYHRYSYFYSYYRDLQQPLLRPSSGQAAQAQGNPRLPWQGTTGGSRRAATPRRCCQEYSGPGRGGRTAVSGVAVLAEAQLCHCLLKPRVPVTLGTAFCVIVLRKLLLSLGLEKKRGEGHFRDYS